MLPIPEYRTRYGQYAFGNSIGDVRKKNNKTFLPFRSNENSTEIITLLYVMGILIRITTSEYALLFYSLCSFSKIRYEGSSISS